MTRMSKKGEKRNVCPKKRKPSFAKKTGPKKDQLEHGYKVHANAVSNLNVFIPTI